jgi:hypothetical protein
MMSKSRIAAGALLVMLLSACGTGVSDGGADARGSAVTGSALGNGGQTTATSAVAGSPSAVSGPGSPPPPTPAPESQADGRLLNGTSAAQPGAACEGDPWQQGNTSGTTTGSARPVRGREVVPAGFVPVLLVTCGVEERVRADGEWTYRVELRATEHLDAVVAALRAPLAPKPTGDIVCTMELPVDPWLVLQDAAGRQVLPVIPHEKACNKPIDVGLLRLTYTRTALTPLQQQRTAAQMSTNCNSAWKNEPSLFAAGPGVTPLDAAPTGLVPTTVCVYGPTKDDRYAGTLVGGASLTASEAKVLGDMLARVSVGRVACDAKPADAFATVTSANGDWLYVELNGCGRVVTSGGTRYSDPARDVVALIEGLTLQR